MRIRQIQMKYSTAAITGLELPNPHFPILTRVFTQPCEWWFFFFNPTAMFPTKKYCITISMETVQTSYIPLVQTFTGRTHHTTYTGLNPTYSLHISLRRRKFHLLFTATLYNRLPRVWFHNQYNHNLFKFKVNCYLPYISSIYSFIHLIHLYFISSGAWALYCLNI